MWYVIIHMTFVVPAMGMARWIVQPALRPRMSVDFSEYVACPTGTPAAPRGAGSFRTMRRRVMSPRGLQNYLEGMRALRPGRGHDLVLTYPGRCQESPKRSART